ncbi:hypothetical protein [Flagellimonas sp. C4]|uniref:hypothetical protein n=1 Tax=Flagellimonas alginolytica TaxID=3177515 RepID=UPI0035C8AAEA
MDEIITVLNEKNVKVQYKFFSKKALAIFNEWNPIEVSDIYNLDDEYQEYVYGLYKYRNSYQDIVKYLEKILVEDIGLNYDSENLKHKNEVMEIGHKFFEIMPQMS